MKEDPIFGKIRKSLIGEFNTDSTSRLIYATDASVYREIPLGVAYPKDKEDIKKLIQWAQEHKIPLIPRTAGTSLAGQVVGKGLIVDVSRHMNRILELNVNEKWVLVEPGVIPDELNLYLHQYGLFFGPETSTANRCMIGGMVGNNSCGAHSLIYGSTRDHVLEIESLLSDGTEVVFGSLTREAFENKCLTSSLEGQIYRHIRDLLVNKENRHIIQENYPDSQLHRRNTGYALDIMADHRPFNPAGEDFNFCKLLCGSEGTLAFSTAIKLNLLALPPPISGLLCVHFHTLEEAIKANLIALKHKPGAIELMDSHILECTRDNLSQRENRFFIEGEPKAILMIEWARDRQEEIETLAQECIREMQSAGLGYHFPLIFGPKQKNAWNLRKAGLGVLTNIPGDAKPTGVIEDTAVLPENLEDYLLEFRSILDQKGLSCVYYAHIATGELHLKPVLNLKEEKDRILFREIAEETAVLVKKYKGSLSGEHGDGRLRGSFIPLMLGEQVYSYLCDLKKIWDPNNILNPGKITATPPMDTFLRFEAGQKIKDFPTYFNYESNGGFQRAIEQCNGSGDCRKSAVIGGVMCPSYMASGDEKLSTRARANLIREYLNAENSNQSFARNDVVGILDLCLSCKGCKTECPSGIDMTKYKAEILQQYHDVNGIPFRTRIIAGINRLYTLMRPMKSAYNFIAKSQTLTRPLKAIMGFSKERHLPLLSPQTLKKWVRKNPSDKNGRTLFIYADEFINQTDVHIGVAAFRLFRTLGYNPIIAPIGESGRSYLSKGMLKKARKIALNNLRSAESCISQEHPLIGLEPSTLLCFRDEYIDLATHEQRENAVEIAKHCFTFEEFISNEISDGKINQKSFTDQIRHVKFHGHCYQKALTGTHPIKDCLSLPINSEVEEIASGCCGMAGSFGYEKEHYDLSMKVGNLILFPEIMNCNDQTIVVAPGTSCRQHICDGTGKKALHPAEFLLQCIDTRIHPL